MKKEGNRRISDHMLQKIFEDRVQPIPWPVPITVGHVGMVQTPECLANQVVKLRWLVNEAGMMHSVHVLYHVNARFLHARRLCKHSSYRRFDRSGAVAAVVDDDIKRAMACAHVKQESDVHLGANFNVNSLSFAPRTHTAWVDVNAHIIQLAAIVLFPRARGPTRLYAHFKHPQLSPSAGSWQVLLIEISRLNVSMQQRRLFVIAPNLPQTRTRTRCIETMARISRANSRDEVNEHQHRNRSGETL